MERKWPTNEKNWTTYLARLPCFRRLSRLDMRRQLPYRRTKRYLKICIKLYIFFGYILLPMTKDFTLCLTAEQARNSENQFGLFFDEIFIARP